MAKLAKFGAVVRRWRDSKQGWGPSWEETITFRAESRLEGTDEAWTLAKAAAGKKWKQTPKSGWEVVEIWMEPPHRW